MNPAIERAKITIAMEAEAVRAQIKHLNDDFVKAVDLLAACRGRVAVMGVGKSGIIGRKIAATMSSVGIPSVFLHPLECLHGDIGMLMPGDLVVMLSYTGETDEIKKILPVIKRMGLPVVVMTGRTAATAWKNADCVISTKIEKEACPYNLAPTSSTTAMLAMGDALALSVSEKKGFKREHLATYHPAGGIGKKLTLKVGDIMRTGKNNPVVRTGATVKDALLVMTRTRLGATGIADARGKLAGFFTDGDLRRKLQKDPMLLTRKIDDVMTRSPKTVSPELLAVEAAKILENSNFDNLPVVDVKGKLLGIVDERDLLAEGIS